MENKNETDHLEKEQTCSSQGTSRKRQLSPDSLGSTSSSESESDISSSDDESEKGSENDKSSIDAWSPYLKHVTFDIMLMKKWEDNYLWYNIGAHIPSISY